MRARLLLLLVLGSVTLVALGTPTASAVGYCTGATNVVTEEDCPYMLCWGMSSDQYGRVRCQYTVYWPCQYCVPLDP